MALFNGIIVDLADRFCLCNREPSFLINTIGDLQLICSTCSMSIRIPKDALNIKFHSRAESGLPVPVVSSSRLDNVGE